jgi:hypothetical protein
MIMDKIADEFDYRGDFGKSDRKDGFLDFGALNWLSLAVQESSQESKIQFLNM